MFPKVLRQADGILWNFMASVPIRVVWSFELGLSLSESYNHFWVLVQLQHI